MAKDLYESRQMYQGPWLYFLLIPIGAVILIFLADKGFDIYYNHKVSEDTKLVLNEMLTLDSLESREDYIEFASKRFKDLGYDPEAIDIQFIDEYIVVMTSRSYFSVIGEILTGDNKVAKARYKGKYNEYKEVVIEEFTDEDDERFFGGEDDTEVKE